MLQSEQVTAAAHTMSAQAAQLSHSLNAHIGPAAHSIHTSARLHVSSGCYQMLSTVTSHLTMSQSNALRRRVDMALMARGDGANVSLKAAAIGGGIAIIFMLILILALWSWMCCAGCSERRQGRKQKLDDPVKSGFYE